MNHFTVPEFWKQYESLPVAVQKVADKNFEILKSDSKHPSLHFKTIEKYKSVRVGIKFRALGIENGEDVIWFWIGSHADYDSLIK